PVLQYRAIEFHDQPVRPLGDDRKFAEGAMYGLVPVGPKPETALMIVWIPKADHGPELWLDANADGKLSDDERHVMTGRDLEIPATITTQQKPPIQAQRTLLFRRSAVGEGLRYTVRGYAQGRLNLGEKQYSVLLIDGNANGLFDNVGQDRVCIDLNDDGRFDALTEQFPLGKPITQGQDVYVISSDAAASAVTANLRSAEQGKLRLTLGEKLKPSAKIAVELVSDLGELVAIDKLDEAISVPYGQYRVSSLKLELPDSGGQTWTYNFSNEKTKNYSVPANRETTVALLAKLDMNISLDPYNENKKVTPGQTVTVQPRLLADDSLYLSSCTIGAGGESRSAEGNAEILLLSPDGKTISRGLTGFS
ncbi:MAG: hypothetical protein ABSA26_10210, partial [Thermoguttaceae bacterium]